MNRPYTEVLLTRHQMIEAIRKIRAIHGPEESWDMEGALKQICKTCITCCSEAVPFPCETYRATM